MITDKCLLVETVRVRPYKKQVSTLKLGLNQPNSTYLRNKKENKIPHNLVNKSVLNLQQLRTNPEHDAITLLLSTSTNIPLPLCLYTNLSNCHFASDWLQGEPI